MWVFWHMFQTNWDSWRNGSDMGKTFRREMAEKLEKEKPQTRIMKAGR